MNDLYKRAMKENTECRRELTIERAKVRIERERCSSLGHAIRNAADSIGDVIDGLPVPNDGVISTIATARRALVMTTMRIMGGQS